MESQINANAFQTIAFPADRVEYVLQNKEKKPQHAHDKERGKNNKQTKHKKQERKRCNV